jgi:O-acetyl-ADP-ribose deacetylase (regulator of RNase III)
MEEVIKDILTVERGIICHQANCIGAMGAGLAKSIRDLWPHIYDDYYKAVKNQEFNMGDCRIAQAAPGVFVAHLAGQQGIGYRKKQTDYHSLRKAFRNLRRQINGSYVLLRMPIYIPYGIGCGLGGGDWEVVRKIIEEELPNAIICKLG